MLNYVLVAIGSALGGTARYWASGVIANQAGQSFPWGTLFVNVTGSFIIGLFAGMTSPESRSLVSPEARTFFTLGLCGGYTTFSSFSLQTLTLMQSREWLYACGNAVLSLVLCLAAVWLGYSIADAFQTKGA